MEKTWANPLEIVIFHIAMGMDGLFFFRLH